MAKPIFLVIFPSEGISIDLDRIDFFNSTLSKKFYDYHVLVLASNFTKEPEFKCFYEKDFDEVKYEELKDLVRELMTKQ